MFMTSAATRPTSDVTMKYVLLDESACHDGPPANNTLPAAKYRRAGKYGRFVAQ